jgi:hypothetical protein
MPKALMLKCGVGSSHYKSLGNEIFFGIDLRGEKQRLLYRKINHSTANIRKRKEMHTKFKFENIKF